MRHHKWFIILTLFIWQGSLLQASELDDDDEYELTGACDPLTLGIGSLFSGVYSGIHGACSSVWGKASQCGQAVTEKCESALDHAVENVANKSGDVAGRLTTGFTNSFMQKAAQGIESEEFVRERGRFASGLQASIRDIGKKASEAVVDSARPLAHAGLLYGSLGAVVAVGLPTAIVVAGYYTKKHIEHKAFIPDLVMERSPTGLWHTLKSRFGSAAYKGPRYQDLILNKETRAELDAFYGTLEHATGEKIELPTLMLYGPPGTAKTEIAKRMARQLGFDFAFLSGSAFSQFDEDHALQKMNELFLRANRKGGKTFIFIDEVESLIPDRTKGSSEKANKLITNFLALTGKLSPHFTIVYATNRPDTLDEAMNRRITHQLEISNPDTEARIQISQLYFEEFFLRPTAGDDQNKASFTFAAPVTVADHERIAAASEGLSGAYIEEIWMRARNLAVLNAKLLTPGIVTKATEQVVTKAATKKSYLAAGAR